MPPTNLEKSVTLDFIHLYRDNPCLWKRNSKNYHKQLLKEKALMVLLKKLQEQDKHSRRRDVLKKSTICAHRLCANYEKLSIQKR